MSVLFISHDADLREVAARVLRRAGWQVTVAAHAGHASLACVDGNGFDVVVVDERRPSEAAAPVVRRLRRYCPALHAVRLADTQGNPDTTISVVRPFTADDLIDAVRHAASGIPVA